MSYAARGNTVLNGQPVMKILKSPRAMAQWTRALRREGVVIGFVPTMGALHAGHRALIRQARLACDAVVVSLFVNPTQFGPKEDFATYPRYLRADTAMCRDEGVDVVFTPTVEAMYPDGCQTVVTVPDVARRWEGEIRPTHFAGVATVVTKLFHIVQPASAYFGQKDFQQTVVVKRMVTDLYQDVRIVVCDTVREPEGLALSSRNAYLAPAQRAAAPVLYAALHHGRAAIRNGQRQGRAVESVMRRVVQEEPLATVDYLAVCDPDTLDPVATIQKQVVLLGAIRIGGIRLIDNLLVKVSRRELATDR